MKKSRTWLVAVLALALLLSTGALVACGGSSDDASPASSAAGDVSAAVSSDEQISQYAEAFTAAGISGEGPFTVFAASNDGITASGATMSTEAVQASIIEGENFAKADLEKGTKSDSMLADNTIVTYTGVDGGLYVNDIKVIGDPITAGNGTVYILDGAIQPKE
jgi:Flp pilus assembly protein TadG